MSQSAAIVLASASPRRKELLSQLGYQFEIVVPDIDEVQQLNENAQQYVARLSRDKALAAQAILCSSAGTSRDKIVIGSDTIVVARQQVLEKTERLCRCKADAWLAIR